jgi:IS5 family transposase
MEEIIPWKELAEAIEPFYPKPEAVGRRPIGIERMLRYPTRVQPVRSRC